MATYGPQLPGNGAQGGRKRNTLANMQSHQKLNFGGLAAMPSLSPESTASYYQQLEGLYAQYQMTIDALRAQRVGIRAGTRNAIQGFRDEQREGIVQAEGNAISRGLLGSSVDVQNRLDVRSKAAQQIAGAKAEMTAGLAETRVAAQGAAIDYFQAATGLQAQALAEKQARNAARLERNAIISGAEIQADALRDIYGNIAGMDRAGRIDAGQLNLDLPGWWSPTLVTTGGGVTLSAPAAGALKAVNKALGIVLTGGGYRSVAQQAALDRNGDGIKDGSNGVTVAAPGSSYHNAGLAIDIDASFRNRPDWPRIVRYLRAMGWRDNVPGEPWHFTFRSGSGAGQGNPNIQGQANVSYGGLRGSQR